MAEERNHMGRLAGVAAISAAVGALAAVMLTPKSGHELREGIADKAGEMKDKAKEKIDKVTH